MAIDKTVTWYEMRVYVRIHHLNRQSTKMIVILVNVTHEWVRLFQSCNNIINWLRVSIKSMIVRFFLSLSVFHWIHGDHVNWSMSMYRRQICTFAHFPSLANCQYGSLKWWQFGSYHTYQCELLSAQLATIFYARHFDYCYYTQQ